jgi:hypothetical protein
VGDRCLPDQCLAHGRFAFICLAIDDPSGWSTSPPDLALPETLVHSQIEFRKTAKRREGRQCAFSCMRPGKYVQ